MLFQSLLWYHRHMAEHRIRLNDEDIALIRAALRARAAMLHGDRQHRCRRLEERLAEMQPGNPKWMLDEASQTHEEELDLADRGERKSIFSLP